MAGLFRLRRRPADYFETRSLEICVRTFLNASDVCVGARDHLEIAGGRAILQHLRFRILVADVDLNREHRDRVGLVGLDVVAEDS